VGVDKRREKREARQKAMEINNVFIEKMDEEHASLAKAFGKDAARIAAMASSRALEHVRKIYPDAFMEVAETTLWESMSVFEKILWLANFGFRSPCSQDIRAYRIFVARALKGKPVPMWAYPEPRTIPIVELNIGIRRGMEE
jgi:hypothetical protein